MSEDRPGPVGLPDTPATQARGAGLVVNGLRARHHHGPPVLRDITLHAPRGRITALLGPNGAGKSTLLKALVGLLPSEGEATLDGAPLHGLELAERARVLSYVPQRTQLNARLSVERVVDLGRFAHRAPWAPQSRADRAAVQAAMEEAGVTSLAGRPFPELSGGEQQRVLLARALAGGATCLLLDEPTSSLDVRHALDLHRVLRQLARRGCVVVVVLHDLAEARRNADLAVLLEHGRIHCAGPVAEVVAPAPVRAVYGVELVEGEGLSYRLPVAAQTAEAP